MKKIIFLFTGLFFAINCFPQAKIEFKEKTHDFGNILESKGEVNYDFFFTNTGKSPLTLTNVKASCGCTTPDWPKQPIMPGKSSTIHVSYNPANRPGPFNKSITISSNATTPSVVLKITGNVIAHKKSINELYPEKIGELRLQSDVFYFSKIYKGESKTDSLKIYNASDRDIFINFSHPPKHLTFKTSKKILKPKESSYIVATYNTNLKNDWGYVSDEVYLKINGIKQKKPIKVTARIAENFNKLSVYQKNNPPKIKVNKKLVDLGNINKNETKNFKIRIYNNGKSVLKIRKIDLACNCFKINTYKKNIEPGKYEEINILFNPINLNGKINKIITIINNDPANSKIKIRIKGVIPI